MKKEFVSAEIELVLFDTDVIATSGTEGEDDIVSAFYRSVGLE